jgi:hypothetical protein
MHKRRLPSLLDTRNVTVTVSLSEILEGEWAQHGIYTDQTVSTAKGEGCIQLRNVMQSGLQTPANAMHPLTPGHWQAVMHFRRYTTSSSSKSEHTCTEHTCTSRVQKVHYVCRKSHAKLVSQEHGSSHAQTQARLMHDSHLIRSTWGCQLLLLLLPGLNRCWV